MRTWWIAGVAALVFTGCGSSQPTRRPEKVTHADRLSPGTAGTLSLFDGSSSSKGCEWFRVEPGGAQELVHAFRVPCDDVRLFWSADGKRAFFLFYGTPGDIRAWEADLEQGKLWEIIPRSGEAPLAGYIAPDGAITLLVATPSELPGRFRKVLHTLGLGPDCIPGTARALRSAPGGTWTLLDTGSWDCGRSHNMNTGTDYTWTRPGVVRLGAASARMATATRHIPPVAIGSARARGEFVLVEGATGLFRLAGPERAEPVLNSGQVEFWPAPVLESWDVVQEELPEDEW